MSTIKETSEYRRHRRLKVKKGAVAVLYDHHYKIGPVIDIARGGLSFRYTYDDKKKLDPTCRLSVFITGEDFYLRSVPVKIIYDIDESNEMPLTAPRLKKCGVKFGRLSECQMFLISELIRDHTVGEIFP
jgi:hypothetical protein